MLRVQLRNAVMKGMLGLTITSRQLQSGLLQCVDLQRMTICRWAMWQCCPVLICSMQVYEAQKLKRLALSPAVQSSNTSHAPKECKELVQQLCVHVMMRVRAVLGVRRLTTWKRLLYRAATRGSSWPALSSDTHMCGQTASRWNAVTMRDLCHMLLVQQSTQSQSDRQTDVSAGSKG